MMNIEKLETKLKELDLLQAHVRNSEKSYICGNNLFKNGEQVKNYIDVYGIYRLIDGRFCFFITDSERGIPEYSMVYETEEEACGALIKKISLNEEIYQEENDYF